MTTPDRLLRTLIANPPMARELPGFDPGAAPAEPAPLFADWLLAAFAAGVPDPQVVTLSTVDADGLPDARVLVLRGVDPARTGFLFWTEPDSPKARQLTGRPVAALSVYWPQLGRQVRVRGDVTADPARPAPGRPDQGVFTLTARTLEFWQGDPAGHHVRLQYRRTPTGWEHTLLRP